MGKFLLYISYYTVESVEDSMKMPFVTVGRDGALYFSAAISFNGITRVIASGLDNR
jgi:hypothetical protein